MHHQSLQKVTKCEIFNTKFNSLSNQKIMQIYIECEYIFTLH